MNIGIVDYGVGNIRSLYNLLTFLRVNCIIIDNAKAMERSDAIVMPGVGTFPHAMENLRSRGLIDPLNDAIFQRKRKVLGICLGFQLLATSSTELCHTEGLGIIDAQVKRLPDATENGLRVPHIGFNNVNYSSPGVLYRGIAENSDFYFLHSYHIDRVSGEGLSSYSMHGCLFVASYEADNIFGTQFHPERSQSNGIVLMKNFILA